MKYESQTDQAGLEAAGKLARFLMDGGAVLRLRFEENGRFRSGGIETGADDGDFLKKNGYEIVQFQYTSTEAVLMISHFSGAMTILTLAGGQSETAAGVLGKAQEWRLDVVKIGRRKPVFSRNGRVEGTDIRTACALQTVECRFAKGGG